MRIVSLLPSATEIVCALGLDKELVGVSHECDWPPQVRSLQKVTRSRIPRDISSYEIDTRVREQLAAQQALYDLDEDVLQALKPDLLITQALCDVCAVAAEDVRAVSRRLPSRPAILNLEPRTLPEVLQAIVLTGRAVGCADMAAEVVSALDERIRAVETRAATIAAADRPKVAFLEWIDPPFSGGHWNPALIAMAGGVDLLGKPGQPSRSLRWDEVVTGRPEMLFIACCGYGTDRACADLPLLASRAGWNDMPCTQSGRVYLTDGNAYFNRPGPRLVDSLEILAHALHPALHPLPPDLHAAIRIRDHASGC